MPALYLVEAELPEHVTPYELLELFREFLRDGLADLGADDHFSEVSGLGIAYITPRH